MHFCVVAALCMYAAAMVSARPCPSRLNGEELWGRADSSSSACDGQAMKTCAIALVPSVATCGLAAAQGELDVINDVACIGAAVELRMDFPPACTACAEKFGDKTKSLEQKITTEFSKFHL
ncbi:hypothetical protein F5890DRAFT_1490281 [Lentinula detonsa]|uniref:Fungal calcium binding protein domain-containing protein n=1 Tax=Lentinula detonsa TaxID=2804962 RepID=A0AA38Q7K2_9AGAR|nr:hypothetical protein F5890DRAFT_1490281 [Lentinula detonsa]